MLRAGSLSLGTHKTAAYLAPAAPSPLSLGMSAFWGTTCCHPPSHPPTRERTQGRRARRERCINKITLVFHLGEADCCLLLFSSM